MICYRFVFFLDKEHTNKWIFTIQIILVKLAIVNSFITKQAVLISL